MPAVYNLESLPWDTAFLGFTVAKMTIAGPSADLSRVAAEIAAAPFRLVYCFADEAWYTAGQVEAAILNAVRVDGKTRYIKKTLTQHAANISVSDADNISSKLAGLAVQAGHYSRFAIDKNFEAGTCDRLYTEWIEKSVSGEIADKVFQYKDSQQEQLGFLTVADKNNQLDLGLLCIDEKARGSGIATLLLQHAENYAVDRKYEAMQLVTQEKNTPARRLFEKYGFEQESVTGIFHIWK